MPKGVEPHDRADREALVGSSKRRLSYFWRPPIPLRLRGNRRRDTLVCRLTERPHAQAVIDQGNLHRSAPMPASRPIWKGQIRLSLVSIPVELFSATKTTEKIAFRQIHEPTGQADPLPESGHRHRPGRHRRDPEGLRIPEGELRAPDRRGLEAVKLETRKTFDLVQFVGACEIEPIYFDKPYFVVPQDELAEDAYRVVRDALEEDRKDRPRPALHARQGISRGAEALRQGHDPGDAALRRGGAKSRSVLSRTSAARRRSQGSARASPRS